MKFFFKFGLFLGLLLGVLLCSFFAFFKAYQFKEFSYPSQKIVAHHGGQPDNSVEGVKKLLARGVLNIEIDLHYDQKKNQLVLAHDALEKGKDYLSLDSFLQEFAANEAFKGTFFWLELKDLNSSNQNAIYSLLKGAESKIKFLVESRNYKALNFLAMNGIDCLYWINTHQKSSLYYFRNLLNAFQIMRSDFVGLSMPVEKFDSRTQAFFGHLPISLFTVNDIKAIRNLEKNSHIKLIITDNEN